MGATLSFWDWDFEPTVTLGLAALVTLYVWAFRRGWLKPADDVRFWLPSSRWRPWLFGLGIITVLIALQSPIDRGGDRFLLSIHMVQHLLMMMVAPPLLLLGIAGAKPLDRLRSRWWQAWLLLTRPAPAFLIFNGVLLVWHIPALYNTTLTVTPLHVFEHLTFVAAGVVFWWPLVDPVRHSSYSRVAPLTKVAMLGVGGVPPTILGFLLSMAQTPFYTFYEFAPRLWGMSALGDQQVAGVIMFGAGNLIYFVAAGIVFLRMFGDPQADEAAQGVAAG